MLLALANAVDVSFVNDRESENYWGTNLSVNKDEGEVEEYKEDADENDDSPELFYGVLTADFYLPPPSATRDLFLLSWARDVRDKEKSFLCIVVDIPGNSCKPNNSLFVRLMFDRITRSSRPVSPEKSHHNNRVQLSHPSYLRSLEFLSLTALI